ncbi:MAG: TetR/AcrR family transcriptional regulator [Marinicaulis sp.]|nr:TetR/AcrR family transcriptional regulator [Marinicaulis sp.]
METQMDIIGVTVLDGGTKARIERAAVDRFASKGVDAVTTREIAAVAGISEGALYRHFKSKAELAQTLFRTIHETLADEITAVSSADLRIEENAAAIVQAYCRAADNDWALFTYHLLNTHRFLPALAASDNQPRKNPVAQVEAIIAGAMDQGEIKRGDANLKAALCLGVVLQAALHKVYGKLLEPMSHYETELTRAVNAVLHS